MDYHRLIRIERKLIFVPVDRKKSLEKDGDFLLWEVALTRALSISKIGSNYPVFVLTANRFLDESNAKRVRAETRPR